MSHYLQTPQLRAKDNGKLALVCQKIITEPDFYHRTRVELFKDFNESIEFSNDQSKYEVPFAYYNSIKSALNCRNTAYTDDKQLACITAAEHMLLEIFRSANPPSSKHEM
jgi:hypothetical protein